MSGCNFLPLNRDQGHLMPPSLRDWIPEGDLAWFVLDALWHAEFIFTFTLIYLILNATKRPLAFPCCHPHRV